MTEPHGNCRSLFDRTIAETLAQAIRIISSDPALVVPGSVILHHQKRAAAARRRHEEQGLIVPHIMILSITARCNLACAGCYMHGRGKGEAAEMEPALLQKIVADAADLGVSIIVIAGGEPLVRHEEIIAIAQAHPRVLFPVFTNGLLIDEPLAAAIAGCRNIVPVISFEGFRADTDARRGSGVYDRLLATCARLRARGVFFGCSITTNRENFPRVTDRAFAEEMLRAGARVFTCVEYVPMEPGTENLVLSHEQKKTLQIVLADFNRQYPALFIGFPGDEDMYGGCLAAGRGFVHVSPSGSLEPCPAAPVSDANLAEAPLEVALRSRLLARLREEPEILTESEGGCALRRRFPGGNSSPPPGSDGPVGHTTRAWAQEIAGRE